MKANMRRYRDNDDYHRIREFLHQVFLLNDRRELSWQAYRFDYWRWHGTLNCGHGKIETDVFLWEDEQGRVVAVMNRESPGSVFLHTHPEHRSPELEEEMIAAAEEFLTVPTDDGCRKLHVWAIRDDQLRQDILIRRGYAKGKAQDWQRRRPMTGPISEQPVADGYAIRSLGGDEDLPARSYLSWLAFHPDEPDDNYDGWEWYLNVQKAPLYHRELDLVAVAADGEFAAFCTIWFDPITLAGAFEPVGTAPTHQRRGLARAVMSEGLRRLKGLGAVSAYVGSWNEATHRLYGSLGFTDYDLAEAWGKKLQL